MLSRALGAVLLAAASAPALAQSVDMPNGADTQAGSGGYTTIFRSIARSYQIVMNDTVVVAAGITPGTQITGVAFRTPSWQVFPSWPGTGLSANFPAFDITMSKSTRAAGLLSTTYTENIDTDAVAVRTGPMVLPSGFNPGGALTPNVNAWGGVIQFTTPYTYTGGHLLFTLRQNGHTGGAGSGNAEACANTLTPGCQAIGVSSYTQADTWYAQGMLSLLFTVETGNPCPGNGCGSSDFNGDGDFGTDGDIEAFFSCLGGTCCATCFCQGSDFNGDGDFGTDQDIESFFRVLAGGQC